MSASQGTDDYTITFVRSAGPGGQNVNKVATAAQLRFFVDRTHLLDEAAKSRLRHLAGRRLTDSGELLIIARNHRTQEGNRREALPGDPARGGPPCTEAAQGHASDAGLAAAPRCRQGQGRARQAAARTGAWRRLKRRRSSTSR
jgi:protein subunit release factor B